MRGKAGNPFATVSACKGIPPRTLLSLVALLRAPLPPLRNFPALGRVDTGRSGLVMRAASPAGEAAPAAVPIIHGAVIPAGSHVPFRPPAGFVLVAGLLFAQRISLVLFID